MLIIHHIFKLIIEHTFSGMRFKHQEYIREYLSIKCGPLPNRYISKNKTLVLIFLKS